MKLNNQKRWGKVWSAAAGLMVYSTLTAVSYSADNWMFPTGTVFRESGKRVWTGEAISKKDDPYYDGWADNVIHGKVLSSIPGSYWGVVDDHHGVVLEPGIVLTFSGMSYAAASRYNVRVDYQYNAEPKASSTQNTVDVNKDRGIYKYTAWLVRTGIPNKITGNNLYQARNLQAALYISNSVKPGTYSYSGDVNLEVGDMRVYINNRIEFTYTPPIQCTINTPPKIDFGKVNIWDWEGNTSGTPGGNRKDVLGVVDGNFMINCTGDNGAHAPAKLTLKGDTQGYANDLKMTMDATGDLAPATVRASIKSISTPCNSVGTSFGPGTKTPPSNEVDLGELTVGPHPVPYRFSLCSLGALGDDKDKKFGAASATATVTIDWE